MDIDASPVNLCCVMNDWRQVFMNISVEKLLSPDATDTGSVRRTRKAVYKLCKISFKSDSKIKSRMPFGFTVWK